MVRSQSRTGSHPRKVEARMDEDFDRFGTPEENIHAAAKWAKKYRKKHTYHTHVPTRKEIGTLPAVELRSQMLKRIDAVSFRGLHKAVHHGVGTYSERPRHRLRPPAKAARQSARRRCAALFRYR